MPASRATAPSTPLRSRQSRRVAAVLSLAVVLGSLVTIAGPAEADASTPAVRTSLAVGNFRSCALTKVGGVMCWGASLTIDGNGDYQNATVPIDVVGLTSGVVAIASGAEHTCALTDAGGVKCWGWDAYGQLGDGDGGWYTTTPVDVVGLTSGVAAIGAGETHTCAITLTGATKCWGRDHLGQLGNGGANTDSSVPTDVVSADATFTSIDGGGAHTCGTTAGGGIRCWGYDGSGQLGNGGAAGSSPVPVEVIGLSEGVAAVDAGGEITCAITDAGAVSCWGSDQFGGLGNGGSAADSQVPTPVVGLGSGATSLSAGYHYACAVNAAGGATCWGLDGDGALGDGGELTGAVPPASSQVPVSVLGLQTGVVEVAAAEQSCALLESGAMKCWGYGSYGQLGYAGGVGAHPEPLDVAGGAIFGPPSNLAPVGTPATVRLTAGTTKAFTLGAVDGDGDPMTFAIDTPPSDGTLSCDAAGACTYQAAAAGTRTFSFAASDDQGGTSAPATITLEVTNPRVAMGDAQALEPDVGEMSVSVPISIGAPLPVDVTIAYHTVDGTAIGGGATSGGDFRPWGTPASPRTVRIPAGRTWTSVVVPIRADAVSEPDETLEVRIASITTPDGTPITWSDRASTVTIVDNYRSGGDPILWVQDRTTYEGDSPQSATRGGFTIQLSKPLAAPVTFLYEWTTGTATEGPQTPGNDWIRSQVRSWAAPAGATIRAVDANHWGDTLSEGDETYGFRLIVPDGTAIIQAKATATMTILDDDA